MFVQKILKEKKGGFGLLAVVLLTIGNTLGGGIFVLLTQGVNVAGPLLPISFLIGGFVALLISITYAEIITSVPEDQQSLTYSFSAYGRNIIPFILTWLVALGSLAYGAVNALGFSFYLGQLLPVASWAVSFGVIAVAMMLNLLDVRNVGNAAQALVIVLVGILALLVFSTFPEIRALPEKAPLGASFSFPVALSIISGTAIIFSSFAGFQGISVIANRIKNSSKTMPRAIFITIGIVTLLYTAISFFLVSVLPMGVITNASISLDTLFFAERFGQFTTKLVIFAALVATASSLVMSLLIASRQLTAVAEQGFLPKIFKKLNTHEAPGYAVLLAGIVMLGFVATQSISFVAYLGNSSYFLLAAASAVAVIVMRKKRPYLERPFRVPFVPYLPIITVIVALTILVFTGFESIFWLVVWSFAGFIIYLTSFLQTDRIPWLFLGVVLFALLIFLILSPLL